MTAKTCRITSKIVRLLAISSLFVTVVSGAVTAYGAISVRDLSDASRAIADQASLDMTRLALQVATLSILANVLLVGWLVCSVTRWASKPCVLETHETRATLRRIEAILRGRD